MTASDDLDTPWRTRLGDGLATLAAAALLGTLFAPLHAQITPATPEFDSASIKPNRSGDTRQSSRMEPGGRCAGLNIPAKHLIRLAYGLQDFQLAGVPGWMESERLDVVTKAPANASRDDMQAMMRRLLADRFEFRAHTEVRQLPLYALTVTRVDGRGPALRDPSPCTSADASASRTANAPPPCTFTLGDGRLAGRSVTMARLASELQGLVGNVVVDQTMLTGTYDMALEWTPDLQSAGTGATAPSLFTALQEQLGLKLVSTKGPVQVLVVDHVSRPTAD